MPPEIHSILGASSAERWMNCPPSAKLTESMKDKSTIFAEEGSAAHALCEWKVKKALKMPAGKRPESKYHNDDMEEATDAYRDFIMDLVTMEKQYCKDSIIMVEQKLDFSSYVPKGFGTGDFVLVTDEKIYVVDLKFGRGVKVCAEENPQMMLYALGALNMFDCLYNIKEITMIIYQPRLLNISTWSIYVDDLYEWADKVLKPKAELAYKGEGEFNAGSWCRFCKAKTCRKRAKNFLKLAQMDFKEPPLLTDKEIGMVLDKASELSKWCNDVMCYAQEEAINNGKRWKGYKLVEGRKTRKFLDEGKVEEAAKNAGYIDIYNKSLITLTAFEKLMGKEKFAEILGDLVVKTKGKLTLVPVTDKRQEVIINNIEEEF